MVKNLSSNTGDTGNAGSIPGSGRSPFKPCQYSCLENSLDRGAWWAIVHGVTELNMTVHSRIHSHCKIANIEQYFSKYKQEDWHSHIYIRISGLRLILSNGELRIWFNRCRKKLQNVYWTDQKKLFSSSTDDSKFLSVSETTPWLIYFVLLFIKNLSNLRYSSGWQVDRRTQI